MKTVNEVSKLSGVSIRTLHYYDEIGLLSPAVTTDAGYRMYDDASLERLQQIMLFKELEFSLSDIKEIIDGPSFDKKKALDNQIELLELKRDHLDRLIKHAKEIRKKGKFDMKFDAFDTAKIEQYKEEAKAKWGSTDAYKEFEAKDAKYSDSDRKDMASQLMSFFEEFGQMLDTDPAGPKAQAQVKKLQDFITAKYYNCTKQILAGLGQMYAAGGEMTENIDKAGGKGTAQFAAKAIEIYTK